ncbi:MAG: RagB/SusD family nutrient uptake outer membrane protein [Filimonas sp.]|nr:RagB/SusD family nutrient uptake outer membrane protein [Filimonas sp.]
MKRSINALFILLSALSLSAMVSCKKQLAEVVPQDAISTQLALTDANATQTLYIGAYARLRAYNGTLFNLGEMRSDIWADGLFTESADATSQQLYTHNISALNVPYSSWGSFYNLIYTINNVIDVLPKSPVTDPNRSKWLAEMYGMRAYIYYTMLKTWGGVPLTTVPVTTINGAAETYKKRSPQDSVMLLVKSDIEKSLQLFGGSNTFPSGNRVYWNRVATLALKGDVYLWSGANMGGGNADFTIAKNALLEVKALQGSTLNLDANYADIFDPAKKANNPEIIFALSYESGQATQGTFTIFSVNGVQASSYSFAPSATPTVNTVYPYVNGANRVGMSQAMITRLTSGPADQRVANSFKVMYAAASPFPVRAVFLTKWIGVVSGTSQVYNNDYPIYRYADVLLLLAEAKAQLGEDPSAEIAQIRTRAYGAGAPAFVSGSVSANINAIQEENLREFIGEGKRWWALRRAGDSYVYAAINPAYLSPTSTAKLLLPISASMINNDPLLLQTPGY